MSALEDKCNGLEVTVDNLNVQLEKSLKNESDLHDKVGDLSQTLNLRDSHGHETEERLAKADRNLERVKIEKDGFQKQLETSQASLQVKVSLLSKLVWIMYITAHCFLVQHRFFSLLLWVIGFCLHQSLCHNLWTHFLAILLKGRENSNFTNFMHGVVNNPDKVLNQRCLYETSFKKSLYLKC